MTCISRFNEGRKGRGVEKFGDEISEFLSTFLGIFVIGGIVYLILKFILLVIF